MSFKLISRAIESNELSRVEDLVNMPQSATPTHLVYNNGITEYTVELNVIPIYFTSTGWYKYISDNLEKLQFVDGSAVYHLVDLPMVKNELFISMSLLLKQNDELQAKVAELTYQLEQIKTTNLFTNVLFASVYPNWENEAQFKQLDDYKYLSIVLDKTIDSFDHNFHITYVYGHTITASSSNCCLSCLYHHSNACSKLNNEFIISLNRPRFLIPFSEGPWHSNMMYRHYTGNYFTEDIFKNSESCINDSVHMYIIGVIAGWIHLNIDKILPYEYLVFIDVDANGINFKLVTTKKHEIAPKRFLYDWRRFIVSGVKH